MDMTIRPRRLRGNDTLRRMVRETRMDKSSLIYPMFVNPGGDPVHGRTVPLQCGLHGI